MPKDSATAETSHVHPIAQLLVRSLRPGEGLGYSVSAESLREIGSTLERLVQTAEFMPAVTTLIRFCQVLESRGARSAARAITRAARGVVSELERMTGAHSAGQAAVARERFARLLGERRPAFPVTQPADRSRASQNLLAFRASSGGRR